MKKVFVENRSDLTKVIVGSELAGLEAYRTRIVCGCKMQDNRRNAVIVLSDNNAVIAKVIRCKLCKKGGLL